MSRKDRLTAFAKQIGFEVEDHPESDPSVVRTLRVPCLFLGGVLGTCAIETSYDPATGKPDNRVGGDVHAVKVTIDAEHDGCVYYADGNPIGNHVGGDGKTWSNISIKRGLQAVQSQMRPPMTCSTGTRSTSSVPLRPLATQRLFLTRCLIRSTYPTRSRHGPG